jgi:DNA-binding beta-propeller fold protein YncE
VADPVNDYIQKFDTTGKFLGHWTAKGVASLAISPAGEVYGLNTGLGLVTKFDLEGKQLAQWGGIGADKGQFRFPNAIAVGKDGSVFVADTGNQRIQKFDPKGNPLAAWGTKGPGEQEFGGSGLSDLYSGPTSIAVEPSTGNLYIVDSASARIIKYDPNGAFLGSLTQANVDPSRPFEPIAVAAPAFQVEKPQSASSSLGGTPTPAPTGSVDDTGLTNGIYIMALQGIYKLNSQDGLSFDYFAAAPLPGTDGGDGNIHNLTGLAVDNNGNLFITDNFSRLQKFRYK